MGPRTRRELPLRLAERVEQMRRRHRAPWRRVGQRVHLRLQRAAADAEPFGGVAQERRQLRWQVVAVAAGVALVLGRRDRQVAAVVGLAEPADADERRIRFRLHRVHPKLGVRRQFEADFAQHRAGRRRAGERFGGVQNHRRARGDPLRRDGAEVVVEGDGLRRRAAFRAHGEERDGDAADRQQRGDHQHQPPDATACLRCRTVRADHASCPSMPL